MASQGKGTQTLGIKIFYIHSYIIKTLHIHGFEKKIGITPSAPFVRILTNAIILTKSL